MPQQDQRRGAPDLPSGSADERLGQIRTEAAVDEGVAGVILHGSRSIDGFARADSDYDLVVIVDDVEEVDRPWIAAQRIDAWSISLDAWAQHAMPGQPDAWNRYALVHAELLYERAGSRVAAELDRKRRLSTEEAQSLAGAALDEYINNCYRSLKNHRDARHLEARLDASESIAPLLTAVFAMDNRVRPYNRYLIWELDHEPLPDLPADQLLAAIEQLRTEGDAVAQQQLFADIEQLARSRGQSDVIDSWQEKFPVLRR